MPSFSGSSKAALVVSLQICTTILLWPAMVSAVATASATRVSGGNTCRGEVVGEQERAGDQERRRAGEEISRAGGQMTSKRGEQESRSRRAGA